VTTLISNDERPEMGVAGLSFFAVKASSFRLRYNKLPKGGHFAAWEQPAHIVAELRAALASLR
jgi:hypothetical protein